MMKKIKILLLFTLISISSFASLTKNADVIYHEMKLNTFGLSAHVFKKAVTGFEQLKERGMVKNDKIISIVDFTKPSTEKRLYIIDLAKNEILLHTYVAHGRGSGENYAQKFSNTEQSYQSSLGFYVTHTSTYHGKHGLSLKLDGLEKGINDKALERAIVVHGADYVSEEFLKKNGRLGRSHGCPAVSKEENKKIIDIIKGGSAMFIYGNDNSYHQKSRFIN